MSVVYEARYYRDPAEVAEVNELKANHAAARELEKLNKRLAKSAEQERIRAKVFKKARAA